MTEETLQKGQEILEKISTIKKYIANMDAQKEIQLWFNRDENCMICDLVKLGSQRYTTIRYWYEQELEQLNREFEDL